MGLSSLSVSLCVGYACTRSRTIGDRILDFYMWINSNERYICFVFITFGVAELHLFIKSFDLISHCNADFGCSIDWIVLAIQLTGWFLVF